jgi:hypothetical protein
VCLRDKIIISYFLGLRWFGARARLDSRAGPSQGPNKPPSGPMKGGLARLDFVKYIYLLCEKCDNSAKRRKIVGNVNQK